jgi:hypothetical protein
MQAPTGSPGEPIGAIRFGSELLDLLAGLDGERIRGIRPGAQL